MKMDLKNKKKIQIMIFVLIGVITLGVGYAAISAINLVISGNATGSPSQNSFSVVFKSANVTTGTGTATINNQDATIAYFDVSGLSSAGDTAVATYTIKNESNGVGASITLNVTNSNTEYFTVEESILDTELQAGESTTATITVTLTKTILEEAVTTSITGTLTANPMENANATGTSSATATPVVTPPYTYTINGVDNIYVNTDISSWTRKYSDFAAAVAEFGHPGAIAHITNNGVVTESYVAFERNNTVYYLKGRIDESSKPVYEANVATLKEAFGPDWQSVCTDNTSTYSNFNCFADGVTANAYTDGQVEAIGDDWSCTVFSGSFAGCNSW